MEAAVQLDEAVALMRMEYAEFPGLVLTFWQAQRLWALPDDVCERALTTLTQSRFLERTAEGAYVRSAWPPSVRAFPGGTAA